MRNPAIRAGTVGMLMSLAARVEASLPNFQGCVAAESKGLRYCDTSLSIDERLDDLLSHLSLPDKIAQLTPQGDRQCDTFTKGKAEIGLSEWHWLIETNTNVASGCPAEGRCATTFVGPAGMGASFNRTSWRLKGSVFGTEMRALRNSGGSRYRPDANQLIGLTGFGPNINIARDPRFGRNSELPGEDPVLSGEYAFEMVSGMQEADEKGYPKMAAFLKHYTAYSTERNRGHDTYRISTFDFFDTYLPQYKRAFMANPAGVMCSYNAENGHPSCANDWLLNKVLRSWKSDAIVTTDCGAVHNLKGPPVNAADNEHAAAFALMNGTDIEMGDDLFNSLESAISKGLATAARVDEAVRRSFRLHFELGRFDPVNATKWASIGADALNSTFHQQVSYEAALQSFVLLKNDGGALPIKVGKKVAVLGPQGVTRSGLLSDYAADQQCFGGDDHCIVTIAEGIAAANAGGLTSSAQGVEVNSDKTDGIAPALALAQDSDVIVLVLGNDKSQEHEGIDRSDTALLGRQESFAHSVLALGKPTVLVLTNGGAIAIDSLVSRGSSAPYAIVEAFNPSVVGGRALGAALFGKENRWGKLPITLYPHDYIKQQPMTNYDMSIAPGRTYRYYRGTPLFPFGFGLSLTNFTHECFGTLTDETFKVVSLQCTVSNRGGLDGDEVLQIYHRVVDVGKLDHPLPVRSLVDFARLSVAKWSRASSTFHLHDALTVVNAKGDRVLYPGIHYIIITRGHPGDETVYKFKVPQQPAPAASLVV